MHTGQHFDEQMSDVFFKELGIAQPKYNLGISSLTHGAMTGRMLEEIEKTLILEKPDMVMVYGDTNSTLAGSLGARKLHIPIAHIEAGLRSFEMSMPEEVNRILTDRISDVLYCPTETAVENLRVEGFERFPVRIINSGDVMYDSVLFFHKRTNSAASPDLPDRFALCTIHRAENTDDPSRLRSIFSALDEIAGELDIVLPIHPRTRPMLERFDIVTKVRLIDPVGYIQMLNMTAKSEFVLTDSGGLQKEAFFLGKFCITLRDATEWSELVDGGFNLLVGADRDRILEGFQKALNAEPDFSVRPYGTGNAGEIIVSDLESYLA